MPVQSYLDIDQHAARPMSIDETELFVRCTFAEKAERDEKGDLTPLNASIASELGAVGKIMHKRWECFSPEVKVSVPCAIFVLTLADGSPGKVVMWAYTLNRMYQRKRDIINMDDLSQAFPWGFPTQVQERTLWHAQKCYVHGVHGDNMMDQKQTWALDPAPDITLEKVDDEQKS